MKLKLLMGNQAYSSWSMRGWMLLRAFEIDFESEVVPLGTDAFEIYRLENFPANTVPALQLINGGTPISIWDSLAIAEFLHEQFPEAGIWPEDPMARASARSLCAEMHSSFADLRATMPMNVRRSYRNFTPDPAAQQDIDRIVELWHWAQSKWGGTKSGWGTSGPYLFGKNFCAADAFFTPVASRFRTYGIRLDSAAQAYVDALLAHPAARDFYIAGAKENWILDECEFDVA